MPPKHQPKPRDTHFLCFPLVTDTSIPQLARSLALFRETTTLIQPYRAKAERDVPVNREDAAESGDRTTSPQSSDKGDIPDSVEQHIQNHPLHVVHPKAHRPPGTFHLTLGVMNLSDPARMAEALRLLQDTDYLQILSESAKLTREPQKHPADLSKVVDVMQTTVVETVKTLTRAVSPPVLSRKEDSNTPEQICISLQGMDAFISPKNARVLYAKPVDPTNRLCAFGNAIRQKFVDAGFITDTRPLVLHATVANTTYITSNQRRGGRGGRRFQRPITFDAREVVKTFNNNGETLEESQSEGAFIWADDIVIDRVRICKMGATPADDEVLGLEYKPVGEKMIFPP